MKLFFPGRLVLCCKNLHRFNEYRGKWEAFPQTTNFLVKIELYITYVAVAYSASIFQVC